MADSESKLEASDEHSSLIDEQSVAQRSLPTGGTLRQHQESGPSTSQQNDQLREGRTDITVDHTGDTLSSDNGVRIFEEVARGDHEALSYLLTSDNTSVCAIDIEGNTALHRAVASACQQGDSEEGFYQCIDLLMSCDQMMVNLPNKEGYTAIGLAVNQLSRTCIKHMLEHDSAKRLHLDYYPGDSESTVREIITEIYPELESLLPDPLTDSLYSDDTNEKLLAALRYGYYGIFDGNVDYNPNPCYGEPYHSSLLEIACQTKNRKRFVRRFLRKWEDPNIKNCITGMPLIHATARSGNLDVLELLLERYMVDASVTDKKNRTILHWLARVSGKKPGDKERIGNCFRLVLNSCKNKIIDMKDDLGNTALYIAVKSGFKDRVLVLLKRGADIMLPINGTPILSSFSTPMLEEFLGDCLECNDEPENSKDLKLTFKYEILRKITPHMAECPHQQELLKHPVASCFINLHYVHMTECIFIKVFVSFISVLLLGIVLSKQSFVLLFPLYEVIASICLTFLYHFRNIRYFHTWEDFLSSPMTFWLILSRLDLLSSPEIWPHMLEISVLLAWLKHVLMIGQLPFMAVEMEMFKSVCRTFLQFMVGCSILLETLALAILISFCASLEQVGDNVMSEILHSFLKTISMFTGESELSKTPFENLPVTSHVIFVLVSLASMILLIISIGLTVFDTQKLRMDAETQTVVARVRVIKDINNWQESFRPNEMKEGKLTVYPNRWKPPFPHILSALVDLPCFSLCIRRKRQPSRTPQQTEEKLTAMENKLKELQETLNKIAIVHDIQE